MLVIPCFSTSCQEHSHHIYFVQTSPYIFVIRTSSRRRTEKRFSARHSFIQTKLYPSKMLAWPFYMLQLDRFHTAQKMYATRNTIQFLIKFFMYSEKHWKILSFASFSINLLYPYMTVYTIDECISMFDRWFVHMFALTTLCSDVFVCGLRIREMFEDVNSNGLFNGSTSVKSSENVHTERSLVVFLWYLASISNAILQTLHISKVKPFDIIL